MRLRGMPIRLSAIFLTMFTVAYATAPGATWPSAGSAFSADSGSGCTLRIHVDGLRNSKGNLGTVLFKSADGWPEDIKKAYRDGPAPIPPGAKAGTAVWKNLPAGTYGVAAIHDENSNGRLDRNVFGIPKEGFGFANNPHVGLTVPRFQVALVHVTCPVTDTTIHLQHK